MEILLFCVVGISMNSRFGCRSIEAHLQGGRGDALGIIIGLLDFFDATYRIFFLNFIFFKIR